MQIRKANKTDLPGITRCARDFFQYADFAKYNLVLDEPSFEATVQKHMERGVVLLLVDDDNTVRGGIAGAPSPWGFNSAVTIMLELFFWVDPEYRGLSAFRMLKEFEKASRSLGVDKIGMIAVNTYLADAVGKMYERTGYKLLESFYIKDMGVSS